MKASHLLGLASLVLVSVSVFSCRSSNSKGTPVVISNKTSSSKQSPSTSSASSAKDHLPPGQAKKLYGEKSAKSFAPGQQKKKETGASKAKKPKKTKPSKTSTIK